MSDIEMRDLKPNQDFSLDERFLLYTWDFNEVQCFSAPVAKYPSSNGCKNLKLFIDFFTLMCNFPKRFHDYYLLFSFSHLPLVPLVEIYFTR